MTGESPVAGEKWRNAAAFGTWLVVGLPTLANVISGSLTGRAAVVWVVAFITFGVALVPCLGLHWLSRRRRVVVAMLVVQSAAALTMIYVGGDGTVAATLVIVAAEVASIFPPRVAWLWIAAQSAAIAVIWAMHDDLFGALAVAGAFAGFQAFAVVTVALEHRERGARQELARANAELLATRSLLAENTRVAERVRIARNLHDTLGHHLTALSIQLEVATRLSNGEAATHVQEAHAIARLLLSDVRSVVSQMRDTSHLNLGEAVRALTHAAGALQIHIEMPESVDVADAAQAHAMLRCVQEIITNAARHAAAKNLWIVIENRRDGIALHARDDGRGAAPVRWGHGLTGMRERFAEHAGRVEFVSGPGQGFEVHGFMPRAGAASVITVVLVDDQTLVRRGIRSLLELAGDVRIVAEAGDGDEALTVIRRENPDVVLLDVRMPKKNGLEVLRELHQGGGTPPPVILLTTFDDDEVLLEAVKAGARGYLLKDVSLERLTDAIRTVAQGGTLIRPVITERVLRGLEHVRRDFDALSPPDPLTRREVEILRLMAGGYSNREIAEALGTAEGTVKNHASSILSKLGVRDRTRAVLKALELGYI